MVVLTPSISPHYHHHSDAFPGPSQSCPLPSGCPLPGSPYPFDAQYFPAMIFSCPSSAVGHITSSKAPTAIIMWVIKLWAHLFSAPYWTPALLTQTPQTQHMQTHSHSSDFWSSALVSTLFLPSQHCTAVCESSLSFTLKLVSAHRVLILFWFFLAPILSSPDSHSFSPSQSLAWTSYQSRFSTPGFSSHLHFPTLCHHTWESGKMPHPCLTSLQAFPSGRWHILNNWRTWFFPIRQISFLSYVPMTLFTHVS